MSIASSVVPDAQPATESDAASDQVNDVEVLTVPMTTIELCLVVLSVIALLGFMRWAEAFLVPLLFGILLSYTLAPAVSGLEGWRVPRVLGAFLVLGAVTTVCTTLVYSLTDDAAALTELVPQAAIKLRIHLRDQQTSTTKPLANLQKAATELDKAAAEATGAPPQGGRPPPVPPVAPAATGMQQWLVAQTAQVAKVVVQLGTAVLLAFFLLVAGDRFRRKVARLAGPTLARRRVAITMLNDINSRIQSYMATIALTNVLIALVTWALLAAVGLEHALFWAVVAGLLHIIPYAGSAVTAGAVGVVALVQFDEPYNAALLAAAVLGVAVLIGMVFTTWLQARTSRVNTVVVIAGVLFFGWLWGGWGLVLAVPILTTLKTVADGIAPWRTLAEFLGD